MGSQIVPPASPWCHGGIFSAGHAGPPPVPPVPVPLVLVAPVLVVALDAALDVVVAEEEAPPPVLPVEDVESWPPSTPKMALQPAKAAAVEKKARSLARG